LGEFLTIEFHIIFFYLDVNKLYIFTPIPSFLVVTLVTAVTATDSVACSVTTSFFKVVTVVTTAWQAMLEEDRRKRGF
jgi:hypothetical protein